MAEQHEKKVEKKVLKERPAQPEAPVKKVVSRPAPDAGARPAAEKPEAGPGAPKPESRPGARKPEARPEERKPEARPAAEKPEARAESPVDKPAPAKTGEAGPSDDEGEIEAEIMEEKEEGGEKEGKRAKEDRKKAGKAGKKKGRKKAAERIRPVLPEGVARAMALRRELKDKTPRFIRQDAYNYKRLSQNWRRPKGTHSKLRHHISYRINVVSIGYGGPRAARGLHPSGFAEVLVHNPLDLDRVEPKTMAARIARGVGKRKRRMIEQRAERKGIRILNELQE